MTDMNKATLDTFEMAEQLRNDGWCVVLKCLPKNLPFIIEGARSEYDAPSPDAHVGRDKWCCEVQFYGEPYRHSEVAFAETPFDAMFKVFVKVQK